MNNKIDIEDLVDQALEDGGTFEYADTLPALRYNVKNWIEEYLDDNDIDYTLTKKDIKLINSLVKDFYDDNVDEGYHSKKSYSIQEALRELCNSKKKINEDTKKFEDKDAEEEYFRHIQELSADYEDPDAEEYDEDDYDEEDVELEEAYDSIITLYVYDKDDNELTRIGSDPKEALDYLKNNKEASRVTYTNTSGGDEYDYAFKNKDGKIKLHTFINSKDEYDYTEESLKEDAKFVTAATILKKDQNKIFAQTTEEGMRRMVLDILDKNKDKMKPENYSKVVKTMKNCPKSAVPSTVWTMLNPSQKVGK